MKPSATWHKMNQQNKLTLSASNNVIYQTHREKTSPTKKDKHSRQCNFCRTMLCKRDLCRHAVSVCLSVCLSVTFVNSVKTNKHIFNFFSPPAGQRVAKPF